jgi:hypothetical protein
MLFSRASYTHKRAYTQKSVQNYYFFLTYTRKSTQKSKIIAISSKKNSGLTRYSMRYVRTY